MKTSILTDLTFPLYFSICICLKYLQVSWESLTVVQKDLIHSRLQLLYYLDILDTYEEMLGGGQLAADKFRPEVFRLVVYLLK